MTRLGDGRSESGLKLHFVWQLNEARGRQASPAEPLLPHATLGSVWNDAFGGRPE